MDDFIARLGFRETLQLYLFLVKREEEIEGGTAKLYTHLRTYLYDHLSIEDMENPDALLARIGVD
jgi:hypothetical protein